MYDFIYFQFYKQNNKRECPSTHKYVKVYHRVRCKKIMIALITDTWLESVILVNVGLFNFWFPKYSAISVRGRTVHLLRTDIVKKSNLVLVVSIATSRAFLSWQIVLALLVLCHRREMYSAARSQCVYKNADGQWLQTQMA